MKKIIPFMICFSFLVSCQPQKATELEWRSPSSVGDEEEEKESVTLDLSYQTELQLADRFYVDSVLRQVFVKPGSTPPAFLDNSVIKRPEFGGACDVYSVSENGVNVDFARNEPCHGGIGPVNQASNNPMRFAYTLKVCEKLVATPANFNVVKEKLFFNADEWPVPDDESIIRAWSLFYQLEAPSKEVLQSLRDVGKTAGTPEASWKGIMLTICISPEWQIL